MKYYYNNNNFALLKDNGKILMASNTIKPSALRNLNDHVIELEKGFNLSDVENAFLNHLFEKIKELIHNGDINNYLLDKQNQNDLDEINFSNFIERLNLDDALLKGSMGNLGFLTFIVRDKEIIKINNEDLLPGTFNQDEEEILDRMCEDNLTENDKVSLSQADKNLNNSSNGDTHQGQAVANVNANGNNIPIKIGISFGSLIKF